MNKYETLKRKIMFNPNYEVKRKLVKTLKKDILKEQKDIVCEAIEVGLYENNVVAIIHANLVDTENIKKILKKTKIPKIINIVFSADRKAFENAIAKKV